MPMLTNAQLMAASWPEGYSIKDDALYFEEQRLADFIGEAIYDYGFYLREHFNSLGWPEWSLGTSSRDRYVLSHLLGETDLPTVQGRTVSWPVWQEFLNLKGSKANKISWLYKKTGRKGMAVIAQDTGNWVQKCFIRKYLLYTGKILYMENRIVPEQYYCYGGLYYPNEAPQYGVSGRMYPLSFIIHRMNYCEEHGVHIGEVCPHCAHKYEIKPYSAKAEKIFSFKNEGEHNPVYMGIELEYEDCLHQAKQVVDALNNHALIKRDGSIHNGFEICTAPATLAVHKKAFQDFFGKVKLGIKSNCGMHVHVDKRKMGELQLGKLLAFMYKKDNKKFITDIAGRDFSRNIYCRADGERRITDNYHSRKDFYQKRVRGSAGKYEALNTSPSETIEFRIFAPPQDEKQLFIRLEFVQALFDWTLPGVCGVKEADDLESFKKYVTTYRKVYPNFSKVL